MAIIKTPELQWLYEGSNPSAVPHQTHTTMNVTINIVELASELAEEELNEKFGDKLMLYEDDGDGSTRYTEKAQPIFDSIYDKYYAWIERLSE